jgi:glycosyltransferase involved in cell wall biosynthesis
MHSKLPPVLLLGDNFGYPAGVTHGVATYFLNVAPALVRAGIDLTVCVLREPHPAARALEQDGITPLFLGAGRWNPLVAFKVAAILRDRGCRVVHASGVKSTLIARIASRMSPAGLLVHIHDMNYPDPIRLLHRVFARPTDFGICVSHAVEDVARNGYYVAPDRVRVVHNAISLDRFGNVSADARDRIRQSIGIPAQSPVLVMVGRFYPVKGHLDMVRMMALIVARCPDAILVFAGDGPDRPACERLAAELGIARSLRFLGHRDDIPEIIAAADLSVLPSHTEGLPIAGIEALAVGRPVVAFDVGGMAEAIEHERSGLIVKAADKEAFVDAVLSLVRNRDLLATYSANAQIAAQEFSVENHVEGLLRSYREAADLTERRAVG